MHLPTTLATAHHLEKLYFKTKSENKSIKTEKYNSICKQNNYIIKTQTYFCVLQEAFATFL